MRTRTGLVLGALLALAAAGCGGADANDDGIASAGGTAKPSSSASAASGSNQDRIFQYAQCMRDNGVPDFPDPEVEGGAVRMRMPEGVDRQKVDAAQEKCKQYLPNGGEQNGPPNPQMREQMLKLAQCMRENGVPNFPDPSDDGGVRIDIGKLGVDPESETFKSAQQKCQKYQPSPPPGGGQGLSGANPGGSNG
jgi:hypothetical protein